MLLVIDIGNTSTVFGIYDGDILVQSFRTKTGDYSDENLRKIKYTVEAAVISSVVPRVNESIISAVKRNLTCQVKVIDSSQNLGISICTDYPERVGVDMICGAAAAFYRYRKAVIVFDLGTASTVCAVDNCGNYLGHSIAPGVRTSFESLHAAAAQLPLIEDDYSCSEIIGKNTVSSMKSGVIIGAACFIDGMTERYRSELGGDAVTVVTGGLAPLILPYCREKYVFDEHLLLEGMRLIYNLNR